MKRVIQAELAAIERALKAQFLDDRYVPIFYPKVGILDGAVEWAFKHRLAEAVLTSHFSLMLVDLEHRLAVAALDWTGMPDDQNLQVKGDVCKAFGVPYYRISSAEALAGITIPHDTTSAARHRIGGRLSEPQHTAAMAFFVEERPSYDFGWQDHLPTKTLTHIDPALYVLPEVSLSAIYSEEELSKIKVAVKEKLNISPNRIDKYLPKMDVDALMVLDKPYSMPVFAFEYDGKQHEDPDAALKDSIKNTFFECAEIPLIRLSRAEHAEGLTDDPRGRTDLQAVLRKVSLDLIDVLVLQPEFLRRLAGVLSQEAQAAETPEGVSSLEGLSRLMRMLGKGLALKRDMTPVDEEETWLNEEGFAMTGRLSWFQCGSRELEIVLGTGLGFFEDIQVLYSTRALGLKVTAPPIEFDQELRNKGTGALYKLAVESDRNGEVIPPFRFERLKLRLAAGTSLGLSQKKLDDILLNAKRWRVLHKFANWVSTRPEDPLIEAQRRQVWDMF